MLFLCLRVCGHACVCVCECVRVLHKTAVHVAVIKSFPWLSQVEVRASQTHPPCTCHSLSVSLRLHMCLFSPVYLFFFSPSASVLLHFSFILHLTHHHHPFTLPFCYFSLPSASTLTVHLFMRNKNPTGWRFMSNDLFWNENHKEYMSDILKAERKIKLKLAVNTSLSQLIWFIHC